MVFHLILAVILFLGLIVQHFIDPISFGHSRVLLLQTFFFYAAVALPVPSMLGLAFLGGLMYDALNTQYITTDAMAVGLTGTAPEMTLGWSILVFAVLGSLLNGFRPMFLRGAWILHSFLIGIAVAVFVASEFVMITLRRDPLVIIWNQESANRILGSGAIALAMAPFVIFFFNALARKTGYELQPERNKNA